MDGVSIKTSQLFPLITARGPQRWLKNYLLSESLYNHGNFSTGDKYGQPSKVNFEDGPKQDSDRFIFLCYINFQQWTSSNRRKKLKRPEMKERKMISLNENVHSASGGGTVYSFLTSKIIEFHSSLFLFFHFSSFIYFYFIPFHFC